MTHDDLERRLRQAYQAHADTLTRADEQRADEPPTGEHRREVPQPASPFVEHLVPVERPVARDAIASRRPLAVLLAVACVAALAGGAFLFSRSGVVYGSGTPATQQPAPTSPPPRPSPSPSTPATVTPVPTRVDPAGYGSGSYTPTGAVQAMPGSVQFTMPSGNIRCVIIGGQAASLMCVIADHSFAPAPRPASCGLNWESATMQLDSQGAHLGACLGGEAIPYQSRVLPYGSEISTGGITCTSGEAALTCQGSGGHGFALSRAAATTY